MRRGRFLVLSAPAHLPGELICHWSIGHFELFRFNYRDRPNFLGIGDTFAVKSELIEVPICHLSFVICHLSFVICH
ncbi:hypothetical protein SAMN05421753_1302 [Planctomicrobium piriforme]|uniref:Uncharacterized protein n=1 Tax=Planctomicrobium piriforme TaxID=1576369 RepID=A0A1I3TEV0_9PLAN|nr:hypothetical protein SAMN05421753_1302 [Planctomicrobium piriforme]